MPNLQEILVEKLGADVDLSDVMQAARAEADALVNQKTTGLIKKRDELLGEVSSLKKNQAPNDLDIDAYNSFLSEKEKMAEEKAKLEEQRLASVGEWDVLKKSLIDNHVSEVNNVKDSLTGQINELKSALDKELIENVAIKAIDNEKGNATLLLPHIKPHLKTVQTETGGFETQVVDNTGAQRINPSTGEPFGIKDLVAEFKANEVYNGAFPMQNSGTGTNANVTGKGGNITNPWKADTKNVTMQAKIQRENPTLAAQLRKAAGKL